MKKRIITGGATELFKDHLRREEKSDNTIQKYLRGIRTFLEFIEENEITKETVID